MTRFFVCTTFLLFGLEVQGQIQVNVRFKRLQYVAYEPIIATVTIRNLAGRDLDLHDARGQDWCGFEIKDDAGRTLRPLATPPEPPLHLVAGITVSREINLTPLYPVSDLGLYHARGNIYLAELDKFFYAEPKVFEVTDARPIWQRTVGVPGENLGSATRTFSLMTNRFPDHTSLYVRVEDRDTHRVYATYSLGKIISFDEPQAEVDRQSQLHVLQCAAPSVWTYSVVGTGGELLRRSSYTQGRAIPHLLRSGKGTVAVAGGTERVRAAGTQQPQMNKLSGNPGNLPRED